MKSMSLPTIAFIGTGVMGRSMAGHLLKAGHPLRVHTRTPGKAADLIAAGAHWSESAGAAAAEADIVVTMLGFPTDVEQSYFGAGGILERARPGTLHLDMTTSSPALARRIADAAQARGQTALDAPVSGGDIGAREARLVIMVGGDASGYLRAKPVFELMGKNISHLGPAGAGQHCKMANQIAVAVGMVSWCEALAYARKAGLDPTSVHSSISGGAAGSWAMTNLAPRALAENYAPGFYVKHILKDMRIALDSASELGLDLPGLALAKQLYDRVAARGWEECGTQALYQLYTSL
ncbi:MAG: NAD(P)-dependent oxidoreductase [Opitutaceae bacterium]